ncbi:MAG: hypothetical protein R3F21_02135 [Myxococcota bacterium]
MAIGFPRSLRFSIGIGIAMGTVSALWAASVASAVDIFLVTNTNDAGPGSLRQAIVDATNDANPDEDRIVFNIPGLGVKTIFPQSPLPALVGSGITIDGSTQPGAHCDSWPPTLLVALNGSQAGAAADGLQLFGSGHTIQGLVIQGFGDAGVQLSGAGVLGQHDLRCNYIGTSANGAIAVPNAIGVFLDRTVFVHVGGPAVADTNLISGNLDVGVEVVGDHNFVLGNFVGTNSGATAAIPNGSGIRIDGGSSNVVGGLFGVGGNVVAGNASFGIGLFGADTDLTVVQGNWIGVNTALQVIPNQTGVSIGVGVTGTAVGGTSAGAGNLIAGNLVHGVQVFAPSAVRNRIVRNGMAANGALGIKLGAGVGATPNDPGDVDEGANHLQNHPDLGAAVLDDAADEILVSVGLPTDSAQTVFPVDLDFYVADAEGEEGAIWIGRLSTEGTDGPREILSLPFPGTAAQLTALGGRILATATDGLSNTSEFSPSIPVPEPALGGGVAAGLLASFGRSRMRRARRSGASRSSRISRNCACPAVPEPD